MSNAKATIGALFGAIGATAAAATTAANSLAEGINIGASFIREAAINQRIEQEFDRRDFITKLQEERAIEKLKRQSEIAQLCSDPGIKTQFDAAMASYADIVAKYS